MTALSGSMKNRPEVQSFNNNLMLSIPSYSNKLQLMRHNYLSCKVYSPKVKMHKNFIVGRLYKSLWYHLADVTDLSHQKQMILLRVNNSISNCFCS